MWRCLNHACLGVVKRSVSNGVDQKKNVTMTSFCKTTAELQKVPNLPPNPDSKVPPSSFQCFLKIRKNRAFIHQEKYYRYFHDISHSQAPFTRTRGSIHPGSAQTASLKKIAVYTSPGQLCGLVNSQPRAAVWVALVGTWQVGFLFAFCFHDNTLFVPITPGWLFEVFTRPRVELTRLHMEKFYKKPTRLNGSTLPSRRVTRLGGLTRAGYWVRVNAWRDLTGEGLTLCGGLEPTRARVNRP